MTDKMIRGKIDSVKTDSGKKTCYVELKNSSKELK
jgi:hypothetical protein